MTTSDYDALLVTGSRALAGPDGEPLWGEALTHIECSLDGLLMDAAGAIFDPHHPDCLVDTPVKLVVTGDASGPDTWARDLARSRHIAHSVYLKTGQIRMARPRGDDGWHITHSRWDTRAAEFRARFPSPRQWPLVRDCVMVADVAAAHRGGRIRAKVLGLQAPWSRTNGTSFTLGRAREAGLEIHEKVAPMSCAPTRPEGREER